jgi:YD repeat-containing protein
MGQARSVTQPAGEYRLAFRRGVAWAVAQSIVLVTVLPAAGYASGCGPLVNSVTSEVDGFDGGWSWEQGAADSLFGSDSFFDASAWDSLSVLDSEGDGGADAGSTGGEDAGGGYGGGVSFVSTTAGCLFLAYPAECEKKIDGGDGLADAFGGGFGALWSLDGAFLFAGDPIDLAHANKQHVQVDYVSLGAAQLRLARTYNSNTTTFNAQVRVPMGAGWRMFYDRSVQVLSGTQVRLHRANGRTIDFAWNGASWVSGVPAGRLSGSVGGTWQYVNQRDGTENYDAAGRVASIGHAGLLSTLQYDGAGRLWRVVSPFGRALTLGYDGAGRVGSVALPDSQSLI